MMKVLLGMFCFLSMSSWSQNDTTNRRSNKGALLGCALAEKKGTIRIRCSSTPTNQPLFVVDGEVADSSKLKRINPNDIERIHILKNTEATAFYGSNAAKGVVLITTKKINDVRLQVLDQADSLPIPSATIAFPQQKGYLYYSNDKGIFSLPAMNKGKDYPIEISSIGYARTLQNVRFDTSGRTSVVYLKRVYKKLDDLKISYSESHGRRCFGCRMRVTKIYNHDVFKKPETKFEFTVFPNPVQRSNQLSVVPKQALAGRYEVVSIAGQVLQSGNVKAKNEAPLTINTSALLAGTYFIRLTDQASGKQFTEKFIVQ